MADSNEGALQLWLNISLDIKKAKKDIFKQYGITSAYFRNILSANALAEFRSLGGEPVMIDGYVAQVHQQKHRVLPERTKIAFIEEKLVLHHS